MNLDTAVVLLNITPIKVADIAIGTCWDKQRDCDVVDYERMERVANKFKHLSTVEHITLNLFITDISRLCLQELVRHRIASYSVESTRYTLKPLRNEEPFCKYSVGVDNRLNIHYTEEQKQRARKYLQFTDKDSVDSKSISALEQLRNELVNNTSNDVAKYCLPESYKTKLTWSINIRSLRNFLELRSDKAAHYEIRDLANKVYSVVPDEYKFLLESSRKRD